MSEDKHLDELMRQCATHTALGRLNTSEQKVVFDWLIDGGHMTRTGKPLQRPRPHPLPVASNPENGAPIYRPGTDFSTHETVEMAPAGATLR